MFMTNIGSVALLNIQRVSAYYRIKINYHNLKLLQALDDSLKWVGKYINNTFSSVAWC